MKTGALTITAGILLLLVSFINLGAGIAQYTKAELLTGTASTMANLSDSMAGSESSRRMLGSGHEKASKEQNQDLRDSANSAGTVMYLIAIGILVIAVIQIVSAIGLFSGKAWAFLITVIAGVGGIAVEMQDMFEDGLSVMQMIIMACCAFALFVAFTSRTRGAIEAGGDVQA